MATPMYNVLGIFWFAFAFTVHIASDSAELSVQDTTTLNPDWSAAVPKCGDTNHCEAMLVSLNPHKFRSFFTILKHAIEC